MKITGEGKSICVVGVFIAICCTIAGVVIVEGVGSRREMPVTYKGASTTEPSPIPDKTNINFEEFASQVSAKLQPVPTEAAELDDGVVRTIGVLDAQDTDLIPFTEDNTVVTETTITGD